MAGKRWKLYYNSGTYAAPTWIHIGRARDIKMPRGKAAADGSRRECAYEIEESALKTTGLEFGYVYKPGADTVRDALAASYYSDTPIQFAVADGVIETVGTRYTKFYGEVMDFDVDAPLKGDDVIPCRVGHVAQEADGTLRIPEVVTVASGS